MWSALTASHRISLMALAFLMLLFAPEAESTSLGLPCCFKSYRIRKPEVIEKCFEQKYRHGCPHHAFLITSDRKVLCVNPTSKWLLELIETGKLKCPPDITYKHRFKFLDRDEWQTLAIKQHLWNE